MTPVWWNHKETEASDSVMWDMKGLSKFPVFASYPPRLRDIPLQWAPQIKTFWDDTAKYRQEWQQVPNKYGYPTGSTTWSPAAAEMFYSVLRHFKSSVVVQIGCGENSLVAHTALSQNKETGDIRGFGHLCIGKAPDGIPPAEVIEVQAVVHSIRASLFSELVDSNDILSIDSTHIVKAYGDVLFVQLHILPLLKAGVIVHIHGICNGKQPESNYTFAPCLEFLSTRGRTEQDLLLAFLHGNADWKVLYLGLQSVYLQRQLTHLSA